MRFQFFEEIKGLEAKHGSLSIAGVIDNSMHSSSSKKPK